ncbi:formate--tetrahydrofolate ligase, partial [Bacillus cereus group sp. N24]|nr:formate--tetrahydrofolate ligase [Bacillus cereus group sp. N24]
NHIPPGTPRGIAPRKLAWKRWADLHERARRNGVIGLGGPVQGVPREDGFDIKVAT